MHSETPWIVESKFEPSRPGRDLVRRERLLIHLNDGAHKKLVLIVAPAGYGKSSLLGQWARDAEDDNSLRCGWLTLESGEADAKQFLAYLVLVLARIGTPLDELLTGAQNGFSDSSSTTVLSKLIQHLNTVNRRIVLILEDYHNAECDAVNAIVKRLLREVIDNFAIFIDSRRQPDLGAFSLIASGDAVEINAAQLRLTAEETSMMLCDVLAEEASFEIHKQTEGWPVAVQLARVQRRTSPSEPILAGVDGGLIASYLTEQILSSLEEETQEFLLAVSFLDRFNPDLTNFVMNQPAAWGRIEALSSLAALFVPLDNEGGWYRLHHLFAEYLRELQTRRNSVQATEYLLRASEWYLMQGDIVRAVQYAAGAKNFERCETIIREAGGWSIILTEGIGVLRNALRLIPATHEKASATLLVSRAYLHCKDGKITEARAALDSAVPLIGEREDERLMIDRILVESMINLYEDRTNRTPDFAKIRHHYQARERLSPLEYGTLKCNDFLQLMTQAELERASTELREAFSFMRQSGSVLGLNYCYIHAAHLALHRADFETAAANVHRALEMAEENFGSDSGLKNVARVLYFAVQAWQGALDRADLEEFKVALEHTIEFDGWVDIYITGLEAAVLLARQCGDDDYGVSLLNQVLQFSKRRGLKRLENFASLSRRNLLSRDNGVFGSDGDDSVFQKFVSGAGVYENPREWQSYVEAASMFLKLGGAEAIDKEAFVAVMRFVESRQADLKHLMLKIAVIRAMPDDSANLLLSVVKKAASQRIWGVFIADSEILTAVRNLKSRLRQDEQELLTLRFVDDILARANALSPHRKDEMFTDREYEILQNLASGQSNKEIARALELTENTVKFHLKSIYTKLSVHKRTQAVLEAQKRGLID